jgi:tyrosine aminotransferase
MVSRMENHLDHGISKSLLLSYVLSFAIMKGTDFQGSSKNPIRSTLAGITSTPPSSSKTIINLGLGDPTHYPLHPPPVAATTAACTAIQTERHNGYINGIGSLPARQAIADYHQKWDGVKYHPDSVVLTHGVGQALDLIFSVLFPHHSYGPSNILLPAPGFSQYSSLLANLGTEIRYYDCVEEKDWEVDTKMLDSLCDENTRGILITNPSNPCGSNFSKDHLANILAIADKHKIPIIADEIYGHMTWSSPFIPLASISTTVPVITLSGLSKRFLLPGWRVGWIALHDPLGVAEGIREGIIVWGNRFFGPSSIVQAALPEILATPSEYFDAVTAKVEKNAQIVHSGTSAINGLYTNMPAGALYMLIRIQPAAFDLNDDVEFCTALYREEAVFVLPGLCFGAPGYFRVVLGAPAEIMTDVMERLGAFCDNHRV